MDRGVFDRLILSRGDCGDIFPGYKPALSENKPIVLGRGRSSAVYEMLGTEPGESFVLVDECRIKLELLLSNADLADNDPIYDRIYC